MLHGAFPGCDVLLQDTPQTLLLSFISALSLYADVIYRYFRLPIASRKRRKDFSECDSSAVIGGLLVNGN
jgi:hypothetical protein